MRKRNICILSVLSLLAALPASADWQYPGTYIGDGWYADDGSRFVLSVRGGASFGMGAIKNDMGAITNEYYVSPDGSTVVSATYYDMCTTDGGCDGYKYAGYATLDGLSADKEFDSFSFAFGASLGWTLPDTPQWRIEAGWDHITKSDYNASPMFTGDLTLTGGTVPNMTIGVESSAVNSHITTDVISVMAFYDFYDGLYKPLRQMIPYVGFGIGYADSKTVLNLSDPYGDLSAQIDLRQYGELDDYGVVHFYTSERNTSNVAGLFAVGASYGISEQTFLDFGIRAMYIPRVKWELSTVDGGKHREWFSAENLFYINAMLGLRFEF